MQGAPARLEEEVGAVQGGGEVRRASAVTIEYNLRIIASIDESTHIGKRDAFLAALAYSNLRRESELTDQLNGRIATIPACSPTPPRPRPTRAARAPATGSRTGKTSSLYAGPVRSSPYCANSETTPRTFRPSAP